MEIKKIIGILIIVLIIIICGVTLFNSFNNDVTVGNTTFSLPNGFQNAGFTDSGNVNISNGYESIYIHEFDDNNITKHVNEYVNDRIENNFTSNLTNFTVGNKVVYKTVIINQTHSMHYWFINDNKTYSIYTWDGIPKMDQIVSDLILSIH